MAGHSRPKDGVASASLCPGHPRLFCCGTVKTWMPGTSPGMTPLLDWPCFGVLFLFRVGRCSRPFAHDQQHGVLVLGAVPMHLFAEMRDKAAGGHRCGVGGIEFRA